MMVRHLLKLLWNRKRASALLVLEIFFSFLATTAVVTLGLYCWHNYRRPLGFDYRDVWSIRIVSLQRLFDRPPDAAVFKSLETLLREVRSLPPVVAAAGTGEVPYGAGEDRGTFDSEHGQVTFEYNGVSRDFDQVMRLSVTAGRWFDRGDEAVAWEPVVLNEQLARAVFRDADPIGRRLALPGREHADPVRRVVGVVSDFRKNGELAGSNPYLFVLKTPAARRGSPFSQLLVRVRPGTPAAFEDALVTRLQAVAPEWSFTVEPLAEMRDSSFRLRLAPLLAGVVMAVFLLAMVGLGLIGVVWQNLLQRTREIGLRRAAGAARSAVRRQIVLEQLLLSTIGMGLALALVVQVPLLHAVDFLRGPVLVEGVLVTMAAIYLLVILCTLQPSAMASRVPPAEALRYE